jgi:putative methionine-R-sulfoxide reductase with GAF domain
LVSAQVQDEVIGVLSAASNRVNAFDESDIIVLQSLAHQAAAAAKTSVIMNVPSAWRGKSAGGWRSCTR